MTQTWHHLLFAHWVVDKVALGALVPPPLELDLFNGKAWIGIVPFHMSNVAPRGMPSFPWLSAFPELNVRTYVRMGHKAGVYFFSLDAGNPVAVAVARTLFNLPYFRAAMSVSWEGDHVDYRSRRTHSGVPPAGLVASYAATGGVFNPEPGTLEYFLTERYCLYTVTASSRARRLEIHHPPWPLQTAAATFHLNTMVESVGLRRPDEAPLLHYARRQDMVAWSPDPADGGAGTSFANP